MPLCALVFRGCEMCARTIWFFILGGRLYAVIGLEAYKSGCFAPSWANICVLAVWGPGWGLTR